MEENQVSPTGNSPESVEPIPPAEPRASFESEDLAPEPEGPVPEPENISPEPVSPDPAQTFEANNFPEPAQKKKKTGLLLLIIILVLLIAGVIVAILFLTKKPEQDVKAASAKFFDTISAITTPEATDVENKNIRIDGSVKIIPKSQSASLPEYFSGSDLGVDFTIEANDSAEAQATIKTDSFTSPLKADLKELNKTIYFKIDGINDLGPLVLSLAPEKLSPLILEADKTWYEFSAEEDIDKIQEIYKEALEKYTKSIYDVDTEALYDYMGLSSEGFQCIQEGSEPIMEDLYIQLYQDIVKPENISKMISLTIDETEESESGATYFIEYNAENIAEFINKYIKELNDKYLEVYTTCGMSEYYYDTSRETKKEDIERTFAYIPRIYVNEDNQEIRKIYTRYANDYIDFNLMLNISYPETVKIDAPENPESFVELARKFIEAFLGMSEEPSKPEKTSLVGTWYYPDIPEYAYTFNADGTCSYSTFDSPMQCTYTDYGNSVVIQYEEMTTTNTYAYRIEGNTLYIEDDLGDEVEYVYKSDGKCPQGWIYDEATKICKVNQ